MRRAFRKAALTGTSLVIAVAAMLMIGISAAAPASAENICSRDACRALDPYGPTVVCPSTSQAGSGDANGFVVNQYSDTCKANWAEGALSAQAASAGDTMTLVITTYDMNGDLESMCYPGPSNTGNGNYHEYCYNYNYSGTTTAWTDMVDGTNVTYATAYVYDSNGNLIDQLNASQ